MNMNQKGFVNIILIMVVVVLIGVAGYFGLVRKSEPVVEQIPSAQTLTPTPQVSNNQPAPIPTPSGETANWKTYRNEVFGFEFSYPEEFPFGAGQKAPDPQGTYNYLFNISGPRGVGESIADFNVTAQEKLYPFGFSFKGEQPVKSLSQLRINIQRYVDTENSVEQVKQSVQITDFTTKEGLNGLKAVYRSSSHQPTAIVYYFHKDPYIYWFRSFGLEADINVSKIASTFKLLK